MSYFSLYIFQLGTVCTLHRSMGFCLLGDKREEGLIVFSIFISMKCLLN